MRHWASALLDPKSAVLWRHFQIQRAQPLDCSAGLMEKTADGHGTDGSANPLPRDGADVETVCDADATANTVADTVTTHTHTVDVVGVAGADLGQVPILNQVLAQALWHPDPSSKLEQAYAEWLDFVQWNRKWLSPGEIPGFRDFLLDNFGAAELHELWVEAEEKIAEWQSDASQ